MVIEFKTSAPNYQSKIVADITFEAICYLDTETADRRRIYDPSRGRASVRLPAPILTDVGKGTKTPLSSQLSKIRTIGALLEVTIRDKIVYGTGVLYRLPPDVKLYPCVDLDDVKVKFFKNGRSDLTEWALHAVTLRATGPAWPDIPPVRITLRS